MEKFALQIIRGEEVSDAILAECATLFSDHYATWNTEAEKISRGKLTAGTRVKASPSFLKRQYVCADAVLAVVRAGGVIVGYGIAVVRPDVEVFKGNVMWVTQLVVHHDHRGQGYASMLLRALITSQNPVVVGVASSHPHGILALKYASRSLFDEGFIKAHVTRLYTICNIAYLADKPLVGSMFGTIPHVDKTTPKALINTEFHTDHHGPLEALISLPLDVEWPLGPLLEGHEFIVVFEAGKNRKRTSGDSGRTGSVVD